MREAEERVGDWQRILNQREEKANEKDKMFRQKQKELDELQKTMDEASATLNRKENDISNRLSELALKEKACFFRDGSQLSGFLQLVAYFFLVVVSYTSRLNVGI